MKPITAKDLFYFLAQMIDEGYDLSSISINYRTNSDSDVEVCTFIGHDLCDEQTNNILESLVLMADASDY